MKMSTRACQRCKELIDGELDSEELKAEEQKELETHLQACTACAQYHTDMTAMLAVAAGMKDQRYERPVEIEPLVLRPNRAPRFSWALAAATASVALLVGLQLGGLQGDPAEEPQQPVVVRFAIPVPAAQQVELMGDFTDWDGRIALEPTSAGLWTGQVKIQPGRYQYVIIVDGEKVELDPTASQLVEDGFGGMNAVLDVGSI
jgi:hypothetical protein